MQTITRQSILIKLKKTKTPISLALIPNVREQKTTQHSNMGIQTAPQQKKNDSIKLACKASLQQTPLTITLWKVTKNIKQITRSSPPLRTPQGTWPRNKAGKAHTFTRHFEQVFHTP
jgi:hypothetical protein